MGIAKTMVAMAATAWAACGLWAGEPVSFNLAPEAGQAAPFGLESQFKYSVTAGEAPEARLEIVAYMEAKGNKGLNCGIVFGGASGKDAQSPRKAMAFAPDTEYEVSLELLGSAEKVNAKFHSWDAQEHPGDYWQGCKRLDATPAKLSPTAQWTPVKFTFKTPAETRKGAVVLQLWCSEKYELNLKPGDYLAVRRVVLTPKTPAGN